MENDAELQRLEELYEELNALEFPECDIAHEDWARDSTTGLPLASDPWVAVADRKPLAMTGDRSSLRLMPQYAPECLSKLQMQRPGCPHRRERLEEAGQNDSILEALKALRQRGALSTEEAEAQHRWYKDTQDALLTLDEKMRFVRTRYGNLKSFRDIPTEDACEGEHRRTARELRDFVSSLKDRIQLLFTGKTTTRSSAAVPQA
jgi:hypothetical protein